MSKLRSIGISGINAVWDSDKSESIITIAEKALTMIIELSKVDPIFETFYYVPKSKPQTKFDLNEFSKDFSVNKLTECILDDKRGDIRYYEKDYKLDLNYRRDFGFKLMFNFKYGKNAAFSYTPNLGVKGRNNHSITYFNRKIDFEYEWFISVFHTLILNSKPEPLFGQIGITNMDFNNFLLNDLKINWNIGIANYFSKELKWIIEKLDIEKKHFNDLSGDFIYCANSDFMTNKELYDREIEKLISINKKIAIGKNIKE